MTEWKVFERSTFYVKNGTLKGKEVGVGGGGLSVKPGTGPEHPQDTLEYPETPPWLTGPHRNTLNYKNYVKKKTQNSKMSSTNQ